MHIAKYKGGNALRQINHDMDFKTRQAEHHINGNLTSENVYLTQIRTSEEALNRYEALMGSVNAKIKSDTVTLASIICTLPHEYEDADKKSQVKFLADAAREIMAKTGGPKNLVYAVIHYDEPESKPHLEYKFCPIVEGRDKRCRDKDKVIRKFCFDKLCDRKFYSTLHQDVQKALRAKGYDCTLVGDITMRQKRQILKEQALKSNNEDDWNKYYESGNKTVQQLKDEAAAELVDTKVRLGKTKSALRQAQKALTEIAPLAPDTPQIQIDAPMFSVNSRNGLER